ncbi:tol-pal system-associated acyl-CoA thioesterase [Caldovatus sediminis]|uniref:Tol-pal system-associated acyl-CoA thioesterase n=1 Tax=Caldovatus sediminis TaxID=2041189 RepID=A0A8J3EDJ1_9PROT|nr:YbgC/FadM family acyl-CoA thioesterase [Caldovatus sediminis]GGG44987.1 tol-pal system-associated acyl-CoA thioesterase [Caldovatus sediminis]
MAPDPTPSPPARRVHRHPLRVYFEDTDAGGMAYHASYLRWAERARTESLRALGLPHRQMMDRHHCLLVVRRVEVEYFRPARLDESLVVETAVLRVTGAQLVVEQRVCRAAAGPGEDRPEAAGEELARLVVGLVCVAQGSLRPAPIPEPWRTSLRGLVSTPAGGGGPGAGRRRAV